MAGPSFLVCAASLYGLAGVYGKSLPCPFSVFDILKEISRLSLPLLFWLAVIFGRLSEMGLIDSGFLNF